MRFPPQQLKSFRHSVIVAVAASAHALFEDVRLQGIAPAATAEPAVLVEVAHDGLLWLIRWIRPQSCDQVDRICRNFKTIQTLGMWRLIPTITA
jgi:hypothetical protein